MRKLVSVVLGSQLLLVSCAQSSDESLEDCKARFADGREMLNFLDREEFGARFTYRLTGEDAQSEFPAKATSPDLPENESYRFSTEEGYLHTVEHALTETDDIIEIGCRASSNERKLVSVSRGANSEKAE